MSPGCLLYQKHADGSLTKSDILEFTFDALEALKESQQGKSFYAFWSFILNPELQDKIVELIRLGNYASDAAGACGISKGTFFNWCARGKDEAERRRLLPNAKLLPNEVKYLEFLDAVEKARDEATSKGIRLPVEVWTHIEKIEKRFYSEKNIIT